MRYAENTQVSSDRSRAEIEKTLTRYGATAFGYGWEGRSSVIMFRMNNRQIKFVIGLPEREQFRLTETGRQRAENAMREKFEQAVRQKWRAFALVVKAKLEAVESGISEFEEEFLAHIVLPNGRTAGDFMLPQIAEIYSKGTMPKMLGMGNEDVGKA